MSVFDTSFYTNHERINEIIAKLEAMRGDLEEINRTEALEDGIPSWSIGSTKRACPSWTSCNYWKKTYPARSTTSLAQKMPRRQLQIAATTS